MDIRTGLTKDNIARNMFEIANFLANRENDTNTIEIKTDKGLCMKFEMWIDETEVEK